MAAHERKNRVYHQQKNEDIESQNVSMNFYVCMFYKISHNHQHQTNPYRVHGLILNYNLQFEPQLGQRKCEIRHITCESQSLLIALCCSM